MKGERFVILIVDDDPDVIDTMRVVLEANDYVVAAARTAEDGIRRYKAEKPDLVIVDLMMEEVDSGTQLVLRLKALGNTAPVYMLSAVGDELHASIDHEQLGLAGVFQKPVDTALLLRTLRLQLGR
jgi:DNA-binding response OmpR family regulator